MAFLAQFEHFHRLAIEATGLDDFGADNYREPLARYLADLDKYGRFEEVGESVTTGMMTGLLSGRLLTRQGLKTFPDSQNTPIRRPIIIIGLTRSGTTVLHRLISHDPHIQHLPFWLANAPMPRPPREAWESNPVFRQVKAGLDQLSQTMPSVHEIHPMFADRADECRYLMDQTCCSNTFCTTANVPEYQAWWVDYDKTYAFEYYSEALRLIANGDPRRWVLKDPAHLFCLDAIFKVFPDACIVHTHRDPFDALASTTNLTYVIREMREPSLTMAEVGRQVLNLWSYGLEKMERDRQQYDPARFLDLHMLEVRRDPLGALQRIYRYFDQPIHEETLAAWEKELNEDPNQAHGQSRFDPDAVGFDRKTVENSLGPYGERYRQLEEKVL